MLSAVQGARIFPEARNVQEAEKLIDADVAKACIRKQQQLEQDADGSEHEDIGNGDKDAERGDESDEAARALMGCMQGPEIQVTTTR